MTATTAGDGLIAAGVVTWLATLVYGPRRLSLADVAAGIAMAAGWALRGVWPLAVLLAVLAAWSGWILARGRRR